ncbi:MAG: winged helix-turn-helix transcriptional regulator, partial [Treponemataceae bacterium]|nr:winged helix-turn-helix transcriptional regulator [Treponemataceae bacterium]
IFACAGKIRDYDISKREWVLDGDSVIYGAAFELRAALDYDFEQERKFSYKNLSMEETVRHIAFFVSRIWQIHAFGEGNTRATAVFAIKYLRSLGFAVDNDVFAENAWYFRNALVRSNYTNLQAGIEESPEFLEKFFRNLLMGEHNELKNRFCHVRAESLPVNAEMAEKSHEILPANLPVNKTQRAILALLLENNRATYDELAEKLGKTRETVRANLRTLEKNGLIERVGADKNGHWKIVLPHG